MNWRPWKRAETRDYTDAIVEALVEATADDEPMGGPPAAVACAAGLLGRALAVAELAPENLLTAPLTPSVRARIGTEMVVHGGSLHVIHVDGQTVELEPVEPDQWERSGGDYLIGPAGDRRRVSAEQILHVRWAGGDTPPGEGPTMRLLRGVERALAHEADQQTAYLIPAPGDPESPTWEAVERALKRPRGRRALVSTMADGGGDRNSRPDQDWGQKRMGIEPPEEVVQLRSEAQAAVLGAIGFHPAFLNAAANGDALKEAQRYVLHFLLQPAALFLAEEIQAKLGVSPTLDFSALRAADIRAKAQALGTMVGAGVELDEALSIAGLD